MGKFPRRLERVDVILDVLDVPAPLEHQHQAGRREPQQDPHDPAGQEHSAQEHGEAVEAVFHLIHRGATLGNAEDHRGKKRKEKCGAEV